LLAAHAEKFPQMGRLYNERPGMVTLSANGVPAPRRRRFVDSCRTAPVPPARQSTRQVDRLVRNATP
jgi:hypothetical protein